MLWSIRGGARPWRIAGRSAARCGFGARMKGRAAVAGFIKTMWGLLRADGDQDGGAEQREVPPFRMRIILNGVGDDDPRSFALLRALTGSNPT